MKTENAKGHKLPEMPFQVDRKLRVDIAKQVTDGIRQAILSGFYKPGDLLPKALDFTRGLHVSIRATQAAYRTLKKEGLISPRRRLGTVVVGPKADVFHGRVVIVKKCSDPFYSDAVTSEVLTLRLNEAGYVVVSVSAIPLGRSGDDSGKEWFDMRQLNAALRQTRRSWSSLARPHPLNAPWPQRERPFSLRRERPNLQSAEASPGHPAASALHRVATAAPFPPFWGGCANARCAASCRSASGRKTSWTPRRCAAHANHTTSGWAVPDF